MSCQVAEVFLYSKGGDVRRIPFETGKLNIITGESGTGKSSLVPIINYCTGRTEFTIPEGVTRDSVAWYGVRLIFQHGLEVIVAKPTPEETATFQSQAYVEVGSDLAPPDFEALEFNSSDEGVRNLLGSELGFTPNQNTPSAYATRPPITAGFKHTTYYLFQEQGLIASRDMLFFRQQEPHLPQAMKDTLPYILGAVGDERLSLLNRLRDARRHLKLLERDLAEHDAAADGGLRVAQSLFSEARQVGIIDVPPSATMVGLKLQLKEAVENWNPAVPAAESSVIPEVRERAKRLRTERRDVGERIAAARAFSSHASSFEKEATRQRARLESIQAFPEVNDMNACPFCGNEHESLAPSSRAVLKRLEKVRQQLSEVERERPRIDDYERRLVNLKEHLDREIQRSQSELAALEAEEASTEAILNQNTRAARTIGRISLYLESSTDSEEGSELVEQIESARRAVSELQVQLDENDEPEILNSYLNRIGSDMTQLAQGLTFEHKGLPLRFDLKNLTVVADRPGRPMSMQRMGSAENWLACHLTCLLALHRHFLAEERPVPSFLVLDQPCQFYFPDEESYRNLGGSSESTKELLGGDLRSMTQVFDLLQRVIDEAEGKMQIIVLEHASLGTPTFQNSLVERPWSKDGLALVPHDWK